MSDFFAPGFSLGVSALPPRPPHLSTVAGKSPWVFWCACCPVTAPSRLSLLQPEGGAAVGGVVLQHLPSSSKVLRPLQRHGCRPRRTKHQDEMCEVELGLQVQLHRFRLYTFRRLPPRVRVTERGVWHGPGQVGQQRQAGVALGTLWRVAGQVGVGIRVGAVELGAVVATNGLGQNPPSQGEVAHAGVAGPALAARGHTYTKHLHRQTWMYGGKTNTEMFTLAPGKYGLRWCNGRLQITEEKKGKRRSRGWYDRGVALLLNLHLEPSVPLNQRTTTWTGFCWFTDICVSSSDSVLVDLRFFFFFLFFTKQISKIRFLVWYQRRNLSIFVQLSYCQ